jgi:hypothetical protein
MVVFNLAKKREGADEPQINTYSSLDHYVSDRFDFETSQELFSDAAINHKDAMKILREVLPVVRSAEILDEDITKPKINDGAQKQVSESLGTTDRTLRNIVNDPVNQAAYQHFKTMQLQQQEKPFEASGYNPTETPGYGNSSDMDVQQNSVIDMNAYKDFKISLEKIAFMEQQYTGFMENPVVDSTAVAQARSFVSENAFDFPEYQSIDEQLYQQELSPKDAYMKRQEVLSDIELDMTLKNKQEMFYKTVAPVLPLEGRLYAKAVELGKTNLSFKDAEKEFERFYLGEMVSYANQDADSVGTFRDTLAEKTGYSTTYLQKKLPQSLGASFKDLYRN